MSSQELGLNHQLTVGLPPLSPLGEIAIEFVEETPELDSEITEG